jgi:psiF repeat
MKTLIAACALLGLLSYPALAANEQQNKMATCNKDATGKKGDERKAFMKECLSNKPAAPAAAPAPEAAPAAGNSQQNKMATCNKEATGKKGDERKKFMSECLKAK